MSANDGTTIARPPRRDSDLSGYVNEFGVAVPPEVIEDMQRFREDPEAYFSRYQNYLENPPEYALIPTPGGSRVEEDRQNPVSNPAEFPSILNTGDDQDRMRQAHLDLQNYYNEERFRFRRENGDFLEAAGFSNETIGDIEDLFSEHFGAIEDFFNHEQHLDLSMFYGNFDAHREHARIQANAISAARVFQDLQRLQNAARAHIGKHGVGDQEDFARRFANNMKQIRDAHLDRQNTFNEDPHKGLENLKDTPASRKAMGQLPDDLQQDIKDHFNQVTQYHRDQDNEFRDKQGDWGNPGFIHSRLVIFNRQIEQNRNAERLALQAAAEASRESAARAATEAKREAAAHQRRQQQLERMFPELYGKGNGQEKGNDRKGVKPEGERSPGSAGDRKGLFGGMNRLGGGQQRKPEQNTEATRKKAAADKVAADQQKTQDQARRNQQTQQQAMENDRQIKARQKRDREADNRARQGGRKGSANNGNKRPDNGTSPENPKNQNPSQKPGGGGRQRTPDQNGDAARKKAVADKAAADQKKTQDHARRNQQTQQQTAENNRRSNEHQKGLNSNRKRGNEPVGNNLNGKRNGGQNGDEPQQNDAGRKKVPPKSYGNPNAGKAGGGMTLTDNAKVQGTLAKVRAQQEKMREQAQRIAQQARQLGQNIQRRARQAVEDARRVTDRIRKAAQDAHNRLRQNGRQDQNKPKNPINTKGGGQSNKPIANGNQPRKAGNAHDLTQGRPKNSIPPQRTPKVPGTGGGGGGSAAPASQSAGRSNTPPPNGPKPPNGGGNGTTPKRPGGGTPSNSPRRPIKPGGGNTPGPRGQSSSGNGKKPSSSPTPPTPVRAVGGGKGPSTPKAPMKPPNNISLPGSGNSGVKPVRNGGNMGPKPPTGLKPTPPAANPGGRKPAPAAPAGGVKPPARPSAGVKPPKPPRKPGEGGIKPDGGGIKIGGGGGGRGGR